MSKVYSKNSKKTSVEFWDEIFTSKGVGYQDIEDVKLKKAHSYFGNIEGKKIIDLGCGDGCASLYFASKGAQVISIDYSKVAIENLKMFCQEHGIKNILPIEMSAMDIDKLDKTDFIYGSMILHHLEPFQKFCEKMYSIINKNGKGFFWENNARSSFAIWFRKNLVGKYGIPKFGDDDEFPLTPDEIRVLGKYFKVKIEIPELYLFQLIPIYLFNNKFTSFFKWLDKLFYPVKLIRKYSYRQYVMFS